MIVVLMGPPGAGKGTQAVRLAQRLGQVHVASGDLFREALAEGTPLGLQAKAYMERGELVPDDIVVNMVLERIGRPDCAQGVVLDGFPRTPVQAESLDQALLAQGKAVDKALNLRVPEQELLRRLTGRRICRECQSPYHVLFNPPARQGVCDLCGGELYQRTDDDEETVRRRLEVYREQTAPLISYYGGVSLLLEVEGIGAVDTVTERLVHVLEEAS